MPSESRTSVDFDDLQLALDFVSDQTLCEHQALVSRETGRIHWLSDGEPVEEEMPADVDDPERYVAVPDKRELDLGHELAVRFGERHMPRAYDAIRDCFHRRGAYGRFKDLLSRHGCLEQWYEFEARETRKALEAWCEANGFILVDRGALG
jgi:hypothetical protein